MNRYWKWLVGDKDQFALETRIFHTICISMIVCVLLYSPLSYFLLTTELFFLLIAVSLSVGGIFYLSRFKNKHALSATLFQICVTVVIVVNYYYNSGIDGPNHIIFLAAFFISAATAPMRQNYIWLPLNIILLSGLMLLEYNNPDFIRSSYNDTSSRLVDILSSYIGLVVFIYIVTIFGRKSYKRQREELIAKSVALEEANQTKNKLLSILGHDLKEPLASLQGYLELLADFDLDETEGQEMKSQLLTMTRNTSFMLSNILAWTRSQGESLRADVQTLGVKDALLHVVELAQSISIRKEISFWTDLSNQVNVKADAQMLELIVRNLLMNSIKFTKKGGNIWITAELEEDNCVVVVKDDGIGIPETLQSHIFRIESGSRRGTASEKGTGLGLMLCREFAEKMEGRLHFTSRPGKGTSFSLTLPTDLTFVPPVRENSEINNGQLELSS